MTRNEGNPDVPPELQRVMFGLKKGEATMVDIPDGFVVAQLAEIVKPDAAADKTGYDQVRTAVDQIDQQRHRDGVRRCVAPAGQSADQSAGFRQLLSKSSDHDPAKRVK